MTTSIIGWDVGGANIKAAATRDGTHATRVIERPFALWREPRALPQMLRQVADDLDGAGTMAVTMTAELADCFATKREGVSFVLDAFEASFPESGLFVFGVDGAFHSPGAAREHPDLIAAANWMASAILIARRLPDALLIDAGSTTTDVIPIVSGRVQALGLSDPERLRSGELVYTGALRTPVCAVVRWVPLGNHRCRVAAEHFAIAADVHLWLGSIDEDDYTCETPDGRGRSRQEAAARLARVVCSDRDGISPAEITGIAQHVHQTQVRQITGAIRQVRRRLGRSCPRVAALAGRGRFLARAAAELEGLTTSDLAEHMGPDSAGALPAAAVAQLFGEMRSRREDGERVAGTAL